MMNHKELFGARIRRLRQGRGWTQEALAERMDISPTYVSSVERARENPTFDMLVKFSAGLEIEMWELFDFGHEKSLKELKETLAKFTREMDEEKLRLAVRLLRAVER